MDIQRSAARLMEDRAEPSEVEALVLCSVEALCEAADGIGETGDYLVEKVLECAATHLEALPGVEGRVADYWLQIEHVPGGAHEEGVVRAAELLAEANEARGISDQALADLSTHASWRQRLVAAWIVREREDPHASALRERLGQDPFTDDNGVFLVREGAGVYED